MSTMFDPHPAGCRRRTLLSAAPLAALVAVVSPLTGCGLRLDDTQPLPELPRLPGQGPHPSAQLLRAELTSCEAAATALRGATGRGGPSFAAALASVHKGQIAALRARLDDIGEDVPETASPNPSTSATTRSATPSSTATTTTPPAVTPAPIAALLQAEAKDTSPKELSAISAAAPEDVPLLAGCRAVRAVAAHLLGGPAVVNAVPPAVASPEHAQTLLAGADALVYGLQVALPRVAPTRRKVGEATLDWATRLRDSLHDPAGPWAPPAPLGYTLPFAVTNAAAADRLAQQVLARFADRVLATAAPAAGNGGASASIVTMTGAAESFRVRWGGALRTLPATPPAATATTSQADTHG